MALVTTADGGTAIEPIGSSARAEDTHALRIAGAKSIDPMRWTPQTPGSWEQGTTILPGESAVDVIKDLEEEAARAAAEGGAAPLSQLLSPAV